MLKTLSLSAALGLAAGLVVADAATAQSPYPQGPAVARRAREVEANGRCGGLSYGTGARRCGTRTGGPAGGMSGRN